MSPSSPLPATLRLPEEGAQAVLLVRAFEEADSDGRLLPRSERMRASRAAQEGDFEHFLVRRAKALMTTLESELPVLARLRRAVRLRLALAWIVVPALVLGLLSNLLGPEKRINVIANPLAGLILWNLAVYVVLGVAWLRPSRGSIDVGPSLTLATRIASWPARAAGREMAGELKMPKLAAGVGRFLEYWNTAARPLLAARIRALLHCGAAVAVVGALLGMYARGMLFEYLATWESTFLSAGQVQALLNLLLGPAAVVSGIPVPDVASIGGEQASNAAPWIHLYAVTTLLLVIAPRAFLAVSAARRAKRLRGALALDTNAPYYHRLFGSGGGGDVYARVLPYSYALGAQRVDRLKALLHDVLGARARIELAPVLSYGDLPDGLEGDGTAFGAEPGSGDPWWVVLFNLSQTPESEVHGELVDRLKASVTRGGHFLILIDGSAWRDRAGDAPAFEERVTEHRRTWDRVLRDAGLSAVHLELDRAPTEELLHAIEAAVHPPRLAALPAEAAS